VIRLFGECFVRIEVFEKHLGKALNLAYRKRIIGNYGVDRTVSREEAADLREAARDFVPKVKSYLDQHMDREGGT
jgi:uncharacterized protein (UPF0332 family)